MKKKVLVLMGGISGEREISLLTGKACIRALKRKKYAVYKLDPIGNFINKIKKIKPAAVLNALHGRFGEDGYVQMILETAKVKRVFFRACDALKTPKFILYDYSSSLKIIPSLKKSKINFPVVIKPINEGSSLGVYICTRKNLHKNLSKLIKYRRILIEEYIPGREIQVAVMNKTALGAIELRPKRKFYDYYAKYSKKAKTQHIMPAPLEKKKYNEVLKIAKRAHALLGCRGITRSDFRYYKKKFYLLEVNTQPGMTDLSLVPEIASYKGIAFEDLVEWMVKDASNNR